MKVKVKILGVERDLEEENFSKILEKIGYNIEGVIVKKNGKIVIEDEVENGDFIELIPVASGG